MGRARVVGAAGCPCRGPLRPGSSRARAPGCRKLKPEPSWAQAPCEMEFGILGAEPSGSFHEEEVVGHRGSEEADRRGGGRFPGTVSLLSPSFSSCPGTRGFGKRERSRMLHALARAWRFCLSPPPRARSLQSGSFALLLLTQHLLGSLRSVVIQVVSAVSPRIGRGIFGEFQLLSVSCHFEGRFAMTTVGLLWELILKVFWFVFKRKGAGCALVGCLCV